MSIKPWLAPDIAESIRSGVPKSWLAPDIAESIRTGVPLHSLAPDVAEDVAANAGGAAGGAPDWVPDDAKIYIDLVNVRAWTEADGIVAIDTLLGSDPVMDTAWGGTSVYDANRLTESGYTGSGDGFLAMIGTARALLIAGSTVVARLDCIGSRIGSDFVLVSATGNNAIDFAIASSHAEAYSFTGPTDVTVNNCTNDGSGAKNTFALTMIGSRFESAINGASVANATLADPEHPDDDPFVGVVFEVNEQAALQSITIYDALPDTAGLSALSETGVTNTAPHDMTWSDIMNTPTVETSLSVAQSAIELDGTTFVQNVNVVDDEGNPCVVTMSGDGALTLYSGIPVASFVAGEGGGVAFLNDAIPPATGDYSFTIRATDPGGLYVEQEFTITVTA